MSGKIYSRVKGIEAPKFSFTDIPKYQKDVEEYEKKLRVFCKNYSKAPSEYVGEIIKFQVADGYAEYMVLSLKPLQLIHLDIWDGWQSEFAELLTPKKVIEMVNRNKSLAKLFNK